MALKESVHPQNTIPLDFPVQWAFLSPSCRMKCPLYPYLLPCLSLAHVPAAAAMLFIESPLASHSSSSHDVHGVIHLPPLHIPATNMSLASSFPAFWARWQRHLGVRRNSSPKRPFYTAIIYSYLVSNHQLICSCVNRNEHVVSIFNSPFINQTWNIHSSWDLEPVSVWDFLPASMPTAYTGVRLELLAARNAHS